VETEAVERIPFKDVTEVMAKREGEGDLTLDDWKAGHWDYWTKYDGPETGLSFSENEIIFVESFNLLKVFSKKSIWDRPKIFMIVGLTGSGKTTLAKKIAADQKLQIYSIDEWMRNLFWKDAKPDSDLSWALERCSRCETMIESLIREEIKNGRGCILDLGFSKRIERKNWFEKIQIMGGLPQLIYLDVPRELRWNRVEKRNQQLDQDQSSIKVDKATFDWMESYFEPLSEEDLKFTAVSYDSL
ncbi:MAG: AAA family ATPase, partial [Bdellovibrionales bacterium]